MALQNWRSAAVVKHGVVCNKLSADSTARPPRACAGEVEELVVKFDAGDKLKADLGLTNRLNFLVKKLKG